MTQLDNILQAVDLRVTLDGREILRDLTFQIHAGVWVGIIGPNGAGKTTLLKAIGGLVPYDGSLLLNGRDVSQWNRSGFARKVAVVRPPAALSFDFRVSELVLLSRAPRKKWLERFNDYDRRIVDRALASVDLADFGDRSIHTLSSGEQQRVFLAQALAQEPEVLLLDEPTSHLDIQHQFSFLDRVRAFVDQGGTALAVIHDLALASRFADYLMVVHQGAIVGFGKPAQVLTEAVIEGVFKMRAQVTAAGESIEDIRYVERSSTP